MTLKKHTAPAESGVKETSRLEFFSDGVFAIAITLLVIELIQILKQPADEGLVKNLLHHSNAFLAFAIGFLTILICWINHHLVFTYINKVDSNLIWVNGLVLLMVTFTPFSTAVLSDYFFRERNTAMAVFGFNFFMISIAAYGISAYVYKRGLISIESRALFRKFVVLYRYSIFYTFLVFFVCFLSAIAAIAMYFLLFIVFAYPREFSIRIVKDKTKIVKRMPIKLKESKE
jgi:uncharacterized membrane protein